MKIVECVANFSEGRNEATVTAIAQEIAAVEGARLLHRTMDPDHHRSVLTFAGSPEGVAEAAFRAVRKAAELIDIGPHRGVHPRVGSADVVPFVPMEETTLEECARLARDTGKRIWEELRIPVYLYEAAAQHADRQRLENVRREVRTNPDAIPDFGDRATHPTAGAAVVGARKVLVAYNIDLRSKDVAVAQKIARAVRASSGGLAHVKALGLYLETRGVAQISMNLTDLDVTPVHVVYERVRREAASFGVEVSGSEIIGLIPRRALERAAEYFLKIQNYTPDVVLEQRLERH